MDDGAEAEMSKQMPSGAVYPYLYDAHTGYRLIETQLM